MDWRAAALGAALLGAATLAADVRDDLLLYRVDLERDGQALERVSCADYFASGRFMTPRRCEITHLVTGVRAVVTYERTAYDTGVADGVFSPMHLDEAR